LRTRAQPTAIARTAFFLGLAFLAGNLWTTSGTLLATATFSNETASGWQEVTFATPVVGQNSIVVVLIDGNGGRRRLGSGDLARAGALAGARAIVPSSQRC